MNGLKIQGLVFDKRRFRTRAKVKRWIFINGFLLLRYGKNYKREPIKSYGDNWRVRQREPSYFVLNSYKEVELEEGVIGVYGKLKH